MISKGIILAGGKGTRLRPLTNVLNKHLLPIYDKPMIYYPLSTLMLAGIKDILLITNPLDKVYFEKLLKNGEQWGISISYKLQVNPVGLVDSFLIGEKFLDGNSVALILGDNLFHGDGLIQKLLDMSKLRTGAKVLAYPVKDPERYGVVEFNSNGNVLSLSEKPKFPKSNYAITGLYFYDSTVVERSKKIKPSSRGELEITDLNNLYLDDNQLSVELMGRGMAWLDTGTFDSLYEASGYIRTLELRQGFKIACPEEVSWRNGWINDSQLVKLANSSISNDYSSYLMQLLEK